MKNIMLIFLFLPAVLSASALDSANADLQAARKNRQAALSAIASEKMELLKRIESLKAEGDKLEAELISQRKILKNAEASEFSLESKKTEFKNLREEAMKIYSSTENSDAQGLSHDTVKFLAQLENIFAQVKNQACSAEILSEISLENSELVIKNFEEGRTQIVEIDPSMGRLKKMKNRGLSEEISAGGIWMYPILFFGVSVFLIACAKAFQAFKIKRSRKGIVKKISALLAQDKIGEAKLLAQAEPYPYKDMLLALVENKDIEKSLLEEMAYEQMLGVGETLYSGLGFISLTAAISPLLGLLGTVTGIIKTFADLSIYGSGNPELMSGGISEALITTEYGLIVAIPSFVVHAILSRRAKSILSDMEKLAAGFLSQNSK